MATIPVFVVTMTSIIARRLVQRGSHAGVTLPVEMIIDVARRGPGLELLDLARGVRVGRPCRTNTRRKSVEWLDQMLSIMCSNILQLQYSPSSSFHSVLLCDPSFSIPSQPAALPASSSALPKPSRLGSRFSLAAFMASMPLCLSADAESVQACEPVAAPTADFEGGC